MTKKFWNDWQCMIGETSDIVLGGSVCNPRNGHTYYNHILYTYFGEDRILCVDFNGDSVDLKIERHNWANGHCIVEDGYLTLDRNDISTIGFCRRNKV